MATTAPATDNKIVLYDVSWETYECLVSDLSDRSSPRLSYDRGRLEITSPTEEHEELNRSLAALVEAVAEALEIDIRSLGVRRAQTSHKGHSSLLHRGGRDETLVRCALGRRKQMARREDGCLRR